MVNIDEAIERFDAAAQEWAYAENEAPRSIAEEAEERYQAEKAALRVAIQEYGNMRCRLTAAILRGPKSPAVEY